MLAPTQILQDDPTELLGDVRFLLSANPVFAYHPERLADLLNADEQAVVECLEILRDADEVLA